MISTNFCSTKYFLLFLLSLAVFLTPARAKAQAGTGIEVSTEAATVGTEAPATAAAVTDPTTPEPTRPSPTPVVTEAPPTPKPDPPSTSPNKPMSTPAPAPMATTTNPSSTTQNKETTAGTTPGTTPGTSAGTTTKKPNLPFAPWDSFFKPNNHTWPSKPKLQVKWVPLGLVFFNKLNNLNQILNLNNKRPTPKPNGPETTPKAEKPQGQQFRFFEAQFAKQKDFIRQLAQLANGTQYGL